MASCSGLPGQGKISDRGDDNNSNLCGPHLGLLSTARSFLNGTDCQNQNARPIDEGEGASGYEQGATPNPITGVNLASFESIRNRCSKSAPTLNGTSKTYKINCRVVDATPLAGEITVTKLPKNLLAKFQKPKIKSSANLPFEVDCQEVLPFAYSCTITAPSNTSDALVEVPLAITEKDLTTNTETRTKTETESMLLGFKVQTYGTLLEADSLRPETVAGVSAFTYSANSLPALAAALPDLSSLSFCNSRLFIKSGPLIYVVADAKIRHFAGTILTDRAENQNHAKRIYLGPQGNILCDGATLFVSDIELNRIVAIDIETGVVTPVVAKTGARGFSGDKNRALDAGINSPHGMAVNLEGNLLFADSNNNRIRIVDKKTGLIDSLALTFGEDFIGFRGLKHPTHILAMGDGSVVIADTGNHRVLQVEHNSKAKVLAGRADAGAYGNEGPAVLAQLNEPTNLVTDGIYFYVNDSGNKQIRRFKAGGQMELYSGAGDSPVEDLATASALHLAAAKWHDIAALTINDKGQLFAASDSAERVYNVANGNLQNFAGYLPAQLLGPSSNMRFWNATGLSLTTIGDLLFTEPQNNLIHRISNGNVSVLAGMRYSSANNSTYGDGGQALGSWVTGPSNVLSSNLNDGSYFIATIFPNRIRKVDSTGIISTVMDMGPLQILDLPPVGYVNGLAESSNALFIADFGHHKIHKLTRNSLGFQEPITFIGTGESGLGIGLAPQSTKINQPEGLAIWKDTHLVFSDRGNNLVRMVPLDQSRVFTIAGNTTTGTTNLGVSALTTAISAPGSLAVWPDGSIVVVSSNRQILLLKPISIDAGGDPQFETQTLFGTNIPADCGTGVFQGPQGTATAADAFSGALANICPGDIYGVTVHSNCAGSPDGEFTTAFSQSLAQGHGSSMIVTLTGKCPSPP